ncbi:MAG: hypothetical protein WBN89_02350 [Prochlorococcaceae cyanobacterium]
MSTELILALAIPLALLLVATWILERNQGRWPAWLERLSRRQAWVWNAGIG